MTRRGGKGAGKGAAGPGPAGRPPSQRQLRVGEAVRHALARILARGELADPALDAASVTVTEVRMSPDLRSATAFVVPFGGGDAERMASVLNRAGGYFRGQLAREVELRNAPSVRFAPDQSFEEASRVERLLHDPAVARDLRSGGEADHGEDGPGEEEGGKEDGDGA